MSSTSVEIEVSRETPPERESWTGLLRDALRGRTGDLTRGSLPRAIVLLAVPMVLEMATQSVFAVVDIFFVARLGAEAVAAVGLSEAIMALVYTVAVGLSIGATAVVARRTGEGDSDGAAAAAAQILLLGLLTSAVIGILGGLNAERLLRWMGAGEDVVEIGTGYTAVMLATNGTVVLLFLLNAAFRGAGDAAIAMRVLWLANALNIVLDPLLIFGIGPFPELGVTGAAVATAIGRGAAVLVQLWLLARVSDRLRLRARHLRVQLPLLLRLLRLSGTGMLQTFIGTASWIALTRLLAGFGSEPLAGYTIALRVIVFAILPAWGLANAAATLVGQSLGAGDSARAESAVWIAGRMNMVFLGTVGLLCLAAAPAIIDLFGGDAGTQAHGVRALRIISAGYVFYAWGMVLTQAFNGAGDAWTPTYLNLACFWLWEIPLAWALAHVVGLGPDGVYVAITVAFSTLALASVVLFRRGAWKAVRV